MSKNSVPTIDSIPKFVPSLVAVAVVLVVVIVLIANSVVQVQAGSVGVVRTWGNVQDKPRNPGLHFLVPVMQTIEMVSTKTQAFKVDSESASSDLQTVTTKITINYNLPGTMVPKLVSNVGNIADVERVILQPAVQESLKAVTARYRAENLISQREKVSQDVNETLAAYVASLMKARDILDAVNIQRVAITDFSFSKEFNQGIEKKVVAEQDALRAENEKKQKITTAEAEAARVKLEADASAYQVTKAAEAKAKQIEMESIAKADAIAREGEMLTKYPRIPEMRKVERWDGVLPRVTTGETGTLISLPVTDLDQK